MEQDIKQMEEGWYWFWPERGQEFRSATRYTRSHIRFVFEKYRREPGPFMLLVWRKVKGGFLYASPYNGDWPVDYAPEGGDELHDFRVCDLPGLWLQVPDPPDKGEVPTLPHFRTPAVPVDTKG